jgi:hypothetical protein
MKRHIEDYLFVHEKTVSFEKIKSEKSKQKLLAMGFSPAISLSKDMIHLSDGFLWIVKDSETNCHVTAKLFLNSDEFVTNKPDSFWMRTGQNEYSIIK